MIVLDVEMPRMDGLTFLRKLMRQHPMPVVLCTDQAERAVTALEMGAIEVIAKPDWRDAARLAGMVAEPAGEHPQRRPGRPPAVPRGADRRATDPRHTADVVLPRMPYSPRGPGPTERIIAVGVSTGGVQAIQQLLAGFPAGLPGHRDRPAHAGRLHRRPSPQRLNNDPKIAIEVAEARHHDPIRPGRALVIPGDAHGLIRRTGQRATGSSWSTAPRSAATGPASRSCSAPPPRPPARTPPASS